VILDYSPVGCELARRNFEMLGIPVTVHQADLLDPDLDIGQFDLVYSLGLIEHFRDLAEVVAAHARLVKPSGVLLLGVPNYRGLNGWIATRLRPKMMRSLEPQTMSFDTWDGFEEELELKRLFRTPVGGFEPAMLMPEPDIAQHVLPLAFIVKALTFALSRHGRWLRRFNHPAVSGYLVGAWQVQQ
jgi:SAM-dependent methyltransferase